MDVEFVEGPSTDDPADDLVEHQPRSPRWLPVAVVAAVAVVAVGVIVQRSGNDAVPRPVPRPAPSTVASYVPPFPQVSSVPTQIRDLDPTLFTIYSTARDSVPAQDVLRSGSSTGDCKSVAIGTKPKVRAADTVVHRLDRFTTLDSAAIIDQDAGLCSIQVRATNGAGVVAVVIITAPDGSAGPMASVVRDGSGAVGADAVEYVQYRTRENWHVTVGAAGTRSRLPTLAALRALATDAALRW